MFKIDLCFYLKFAKVDQTFAANYPCLRVSLTCLTRRCSMRNECVTDHLETQGRLRGSAIVAGVHRC